jgi:pimeloyl-ACP methyl ester carboxylesterase
MQHGRKITNRMRLVLAVAIFLTVPAAFAADDSLYKREPGPHEVRIIESVTVNDPQQDRDVVFRVIYPDGDGPYPLVAFSSGMFCYPQMYDRITTHWASHGYVVVLPNHLDSPNLGKIKPEYLAKLLSSRIRDMSFAVDSLAKIPAPVDRERIAVAGHSFGGMISMVKSGLTLKESEYIYSGSTADERFRAAVVMSGVGQMKQMSDGAFDHLTGPLIATGGTLDVGNVGTGEIFPWEWRMSPFTLSPAGDKYSVVLENGDHYLGGLICREGKGGEPDPEGVAIDRALTTAFLDAYVKDDAAAKTFLETADVRALTGGRADFRRK